MLPKKKVTWIHRKSNKFSEIPMSLDGSQICKKRFILDDEAYFTLTKHPMSGNNVFYSNNVAMSLPEIKFQFQKKFQLKVMPYVAVSNVSVSQPYFMPSGLAINQKCLSK